MPGKVREWPAWAEYTSEGPVEAKDSDFLATKKAIIVEYGQDALRESWLKVCEELKGITDEIASKGHSIIPTFEGASLLENGFTESQKAEVKRIGSFVVRGIIPKTEASALYSDMRNYVAANKDRIKGWPVESPSMLILYSSPTQNTLRSHPNHLKLQRMLNDLWHDSTGETSSDPIVYYDGLRDRAPRQEFLGLGPHIDAGSLCRWADPTYRKAYDKIFSGSPEFHDCYDLARRISANQELFKGMAHSSVFRSFQGWTALTQTAPNEGTILVYPNVAMAISYILLRPFFCPPSDPAEIMDASKWTFDETSWFPGTFKPDSQRLSRTSHPHLRLEECLVHMPSIQAGDTVWWHTDVSTFQPQTLERAD